MIDLSASPQAMSAEAEIWMYGSVARGTYSQSSDLDVLVLSDNDPDPSLLEAIVTALPQAQHLSVRRYTWHEIAEMAKYGSLFLWHLKLEGRRLHGTTRTQGLTEMLEGLPTYQKGNRDIRGFTQALGDVQWALCDALDDDDILFELAAIATVIRHCSILACYKLGIPRFQMEDSISESFAAVDMSEFADAAVELYRFRIANSRNIPAPTKPDLRVAELWLRRAQTYVEKVGYL